MVADSRISYVDGLTDFQNVQDQERSKFQQDDAYAQSQGLVIQNLIALYRALGGGWSEPPAARAPGQQPPQPPPGPIKTEATPPATKTAG